MIQSEALILMLRGLVERQMRIGLFVKGPAEDSMEAISTEFEHADAEAKSMAKRDWLVDEDRIIATADKRTFNFKGPAGKILGWYLETVKDKTVLSFEYFKDPVPINSSEDTVSVTPRIELRHLQ